MHRHRLAGDVEAIALPQPPPAVVAVNAFVLCPVALPVAMHQVMAMQWIYQRALEEAKAVARPSLPERDLLAVWN